MSVKFLKLQGINGLPVYVRPDKIDTISEIGSAPPEDAEGNYTSNRTAFWTVIKAGDFQVMVGDLPEEILSAMESEVLTIDEDAFCAANPEFLGKVRAHYDTLQDEWAQYLVDHAKFYPRKTPQKYFTYFEKMGVETQAGLVLREIVAPE
jgi:hypothetical protein